MAVWLSSEHSSFLNGRMVQSNWPIDELMSQKDEIVGNNDLKTVLQGKLGIES